MTKRLSRLHQIAQFVNPNGGCSEDYRAWIIFARQLERELSAARAALAAARPSENDVANAAEMLKWDSHEDWKNVARELLRIAKVTG